jgi:hypothetical protein
MAILYYRLVTTNCFRIEMYILYAEKWKKADIKKRRKVITPNEM